MNESTGKHGYDDFMDGCNLWSYVLPDDPSAERKSRRDFRQC